MHIHTCTHPHPPSCPHPRLDQSCCFFGFVLRHTLVPCTAHAFLRQSHHRLRWLKTPGPIGVLFRFVWLEKDGFHWFRLCFLCIYQGTPSILPKGHQKHQAKPRQEVALNHTCLDLAVQHGQQFPCVKGDPTRVLGLGVVSFKTTIQKGLPKLRPTETTHARDWIVPLPRSAHAACNKLKKPWFMFHMGVGQNFKAPDRRF